MPERNNSRLAAKWVEDPIDDTPMRRPARSPRSLYPGSAAQRNPQSQLGRPPLEHQRTTDLTTGLRPKGVLEGARIDICGTDLHRLPGLRAR